MILCRISGDLQVLGYVVAVVIGWLFGRFLARHT
jgi:hypothetical protein